MKKKTEKLLINIFKHGLLMFGVFGFVVVAALPTIIFASMSGSLKLEDYGLLMKLVVTIIGLIAITLTAFLQVVWLWVLLSFTNSIGEERTFIESLKYYKDSWNKQVKQIFKTTEEGIY